MKVLWFTGNGAIYAESNKYNGGGWVSSLANQFIQTYPDIKIGMAIPWNHTFKEEKNNVKFYGIPPIKYGIVRYHKKLTKQIQVLKQIVEDFQPDIIHVFGSEHTGGMVTQITKIPVVIHLQGIMNYLEQGWLPYNLSWEKFILWNPMQWAHKKALMRNCKTEKIILNACSYFMGRTEMDYRMSKFLSPTSNYFYCSEMLRPQIYYTKNVWTSHPTREKKKIISIITAPIYKGGDIILRTAQVLKTYTKIDFEWDVYGLTTMKNWERLTRISHKNVNINIRGIIDAESLIKKVADSDVFVHPSYIENSPNTVCEAQIIGIPVIATYTGGIPSLIEHNKNGILVPTNDIFATADYIQKLLTNIELAEQIGNEGRKCAIERHRPEQIVKNVMEIYNKITQNHDN